MVGKERERSHFLAESERPRQKTRQGKRTPSVNTLQDLITLAEVAVAFGGCPLCGEHHPLTFHSYPYRWAIGSDGERSRIRILAIHCQDSRNARKPYTKRILPEHLIWRSPLWSEKLVGLLEAGANTAHGFTNMACRALGCIDPRTARKHINALSNAVATKLPILAELGASALSSTESQAFLPGTNPFVILNLLWDGFLKTTVELSGSLAAAAIKPILWLGPGFEAFRYFNRSCIPIA